MTLMTVIIIQVQIKVRISNTDFQCRQPSYTYITYLTICLTKLMLHSKSDFIMIHDFFVKVQK